MNEKEYKKRLLDIRTDIAMIEVSHHKDNSVDYEKELDRLKKEAKDIRREFANTRVSSIREDIVEERGMKNGKY